MLIKQNSETSRSGSRVNVLAAVALTAGLVLSAMPAK